MIDLATLGDSDGFVINGAPFGFTGYSVAGAGDVNGDGFDDLLVGTPFANAFAGAAYVVFGRAGGARPDIDLAALAAGDGFGVLPSSGIALGRELSGAGDINGDGLGDFVVAAGTTAVYIVYGTAGTRAAVATADFPNADGFRLDSVVASVSGAGDVNGDGIDDLIVGNPVDNAAYVVFGKAGAFRGDLVPASVSGDVGFRIKGSSGSAAGVGVASGGDLNGDGVDDLIVSAPGRSGFASAVYVIFGKTGPSRTDVDLENLGAGDGFRIAGGPGDQGFGRGVSGVGDVNGDGIDDLVISAPYADSGAGRAYVIFGTAAGARGDIDLASLAATDGFQIDGRSASLAGFSISGAGDINGDGLDDLIVGAPGDSSNVNRAGSAFVIFGRSGPTRSAIDLADLANADGAKIAGSAVFGYAGLDVSGAGDVNGDGFDDLIVGAPAESDSAGKAYILFGSAGFGDVGPELATPIADQSSLEDGLWSFTVPAGSFNDPNEDPLNYGASLADGSPLPAWLSFDAATRTFSGTPPLDFHGDIELKVTASANGLAASDTFTLTITPVSDARIFLGTAGGNVFVAPDDPNDRWTVDGRAGADNITTSGGSDTIIGGWGNDTINAGGGDDFIIFDIAGASGDRNSIDGGAGFDELRALVANAQIGLASLANVERISANGHAGVGIALTNAADTLDLSGVELDGITAIKGGAGNDTIIGSAGDDTILGEAGNDSLAGGNGNDSFIVSGNVTLDRFDGGAGTDTIRATAAATQIAVASFSNVEVIDAGGFGNVVLLGTSAAETIDLSAVTLIGIARIDAGAGSDIIIGSAGADRIEGGSNADTITGGAGADIVDYDAASQSTLAGSDMITDFQAGTDVIDLLDIDANTRVTGNQAFDFIGSGAFTKVAGQLRIDTSGGVTQVLGDTNGDGKADLVIRLAGDVALAGGDFLL
ncbi:hypothetical protein IP88_07305 [alpha proteobacterium AAP81b]|nr:hypothetical protein IP88_07305 [alpha proteobacterium AAP81b]